MAATCPTSSFTPRTSPAPCAPVPACGLELARSSTAFPKKTLPLTAASAVRKTTSGVLVSSPAGSSSRRAITPFPSPVGFSEKNAKNCSVTERHDRCSYAILSDHFSGNPTYQELARVVVPKQTSRSGLLICARQNQLIGTDSGIRDYVIRCTRVPGCFVKRDGHSDAIELYRFGVHSTFLSPGGTMLPFFRALRFLPAFLVACSFHLPAQDMPVRVEAIRLMERAN